MPHEHRTDPEEIGQAAHEHLSLVRAQVHAHLTGDTSMVKRWHAVYGRVPLFTPTHDMSEAEYEAKLTEAASRHFARNLVGAALVTQILALQLSLAVGRPPDELLAEIEARARAGAR